MKQQKGIATVEYILIAIVIVFSWSFVRVVKQGISNHQADYLWSISRYDR